MLFSLLAALIFGALLCLFVAFFTQRVYVDPARVTLRAYESSQHVSGESFEVLFTPYEPKVFGHDPARENYSLIVNDEGFGLKVSFPASLYSRHKPLFFPWSSVRSLDRSFLTNIIVRVQGREEGFYIYAGVLGSRRLNEKWREFNLKGKKIAAGTSPAPAVGI